MLSMPLLVAHRLLATAAASTTTSVAAAAAAAASWWHHREQLSVVDSILQCVGRRRQPLVHGSDCHYSLIGRHLH